jgi:hypothetical protein
MRRITGHAAAAAIGVSVAVASSPAPPPFEIGAPFPAIALPSLEGGRLSSPAEFRGKKTVLHVFASW